MALALLSGGAVLALFIDVAHLSPRGLDVVAHIQIVPMMMAGMTAGLLLMGLFTLLFGRWYCSVLCPLGVLQDVIGHIHRWCASLAGRRRSLRARHSRPLNVVRYGIAGAVGAAWLLGTTLPLTLTDPYSNFGRIATALLRPVAVGINNAVASALNSIGNYSVWVVRNVEVGGAVFAFALLVLAALIVMVTLRGRLWCNTLCPVGTLLGVLSRVSLLRIRIDPSLCNGCGMCEASCKARCIDSKSATIDASRCVACFNCLGKCNKGAVSYVGATAQKERKAVPAPAHCAPCDSSRRDFLKLSIGALAVLPATKLMAAAGEGRKIYPMPPGAGSRARFEGKCTACLLCVSACPTKVLKPATLENGLSGVMQPYMKFRVESFCNFECDECIRVCPNHALQPMTIEEKKLTRVGVAEFHRPRCIVFTEGQDCGACAEHCPTQAVHMVPWGEGTLTIPQVDAEYCIGCGGCESICPTTPRAITIRGTDVQDLASPPKKDDFEAGEVTDFGF